MDVYYSGADRTSQDFLRSSSYFTGRQMAKVNGLVWHTTEGTSWPAYAGGGTAPTFTYHPVLHQLRQHCPVNYASRSLVDSAGGVVTNRLNVAQLEVIGTSGWAALPAAYHIANLDAQAIADLAALVNWLEAWGVPKVAPVSFTSPRRMTPAEWSSFTGHCGHVHVPENNHTDPGPLPLAAIFAAGTRPAPSGKDANDMAIASRADIAELYRQKLMRTGSDSEINGWWFDAIKRNRPISAVYAELDASEEARRRAINLAYRVMRGADYQPTPEEYASHLRVASADQIAANIKASPEWAEASKRAASKS